MAKVAVCTSVYEAARPYLAAFLDGLRSFSGALGDSVGLVVANDGLNDPVQALRGTPGPLLVHDAHDLSLAGVRSVMLQAAAATAFDALVFCDADDFLLADAARHCATLESAAISFGDLLLVDGNGLQTGRRFLEGCHVPETVRGPQDLMQRNFLGFSNTAVRREIVRDAAARIPPAQIAVDWWFYATLVEHGHEARFCGGTVAAYRAHDGNILGHGSDTTLAAVLRHCDLLTTHYRSLPPSRERAAWAEKIEGLQRTVAASPETVLPHIAAQARQPHVWFEHLTAVARRFPARFQ